MGTEAPRDAGSDGTQPGSSSPVEPSGKARGTNRGTDRRVALEAAVRAALDAGDHGLAAELLGVMRRRGDLDPLPEGVVDLEDARVRRAR